MLNFACQQSKSETPKQEKGFLLDSIFPTDKIVSITVTNNSDKHTLADKELITLKEQLKKAKFAGRLLI